MEVQIHSIRIHVVRAWLDIDKCLTWKAPPTLLGLIPPYVYSNQGEFTPSHAVGTQCVPMTSLIAGKQLNSIAY